MVNGKKIHLISSIAGFSGGILLLAAHHLGIEDSNLHGFLDFVAIGLLAMPVWVNISTYKR